MVLTCIAPMAVVQRFKDQTFIRSKLTAEEEKYSQQEVKKGRPPLEPLQPGERVVTRGVVQLLQAFDELVTQKQQKKADAEASAK